MIERPWFAQTIMHVTSFLQGGAGRVACDLMLLQRKQGSKVYCLLNRTEYNGYLTYPQYLNELRDAGVELLFKDYLFKRDECIIPEVVSELAILIDSSCICFIHCHTAWASRLCAQAVQKLSSLVPIIQTVHGWGNNKTPKQERQDIEALNLVDAVVCVSRADLTMLVSKGLKNNNAYVVMNGIRKLNSEFAPFACSMTSVQTQKKLGKIMLVCVGSVCERKNQLGLIRAMLMLKSSDVPAHLVIVGDAENKYLEALDAEVKRCELAEDVTIYDQRDDIVEQLNWFDAYCSASVSEGLPLSVLEAYRAGLPVILSDIDAHREIVEIAGVGSLFNSNEPSTFVDRVNELFKLGSDYRENLSARYTSAFSESMELEIMLSGYRKVYENLHPVNNWCE